MVEHGIGVGSLVSRGIGAALPLAVAVASVSAGGAGWAATITQSLPLSAGPITFSDTGVDAYATPFDDSLGTLTAVTARVTGALTPGIEAFDVPSPLPSVFTAPVTFNPRLSIAAPGSVSQALAAQTTSFTSGPTPNIEIAAGTPTPVDLSETVAPGDLLVLPGRGVDFYITGHSAPIFAVPSPTFFGRYDGEDLVTLSGRLDVTYTYTPAGDPPVGDDPPAGDDPVPEPGSLGLVGAALAALGVIARRSG